MLDLSKEHLKKGGYSTEETKQSLRVSDLSPVLKDIPYFYEVLNQNKTFNLHERAAHVFSEASRVYKYKEVCNDDSLPEEDKI
jgi:N-acetylgalactosamine kinase